MRGIERTRRVPIIFVTAGTRDPQRVFQGYENGAVDFLYKPIDPQILTSKVNVFLELAQQRRQLAQALQLNELFVGILGHDLRNPLSALITGVEVLSAKLSDESHHELLDRMRSAGRRMQAMITELLDLTHARLAPGLGLARSREPIDLRDALRRTIDELRVTHEREVALDGADACVVSGDPERLLQLFSNLISNALVHGQAGTPVTVRLAQVAAEAVVEVHNLGAIPPEVRATLFEPFQRQRRPSHGLGLGLYIARQIAKAHGGDITVTSSDGDGTQFTVRLPRS
jgi:signal transduction histidine kinase